MTTVLIPKINSEFKYLVIMKNIKKSIVSRLSLRKPQEDSLDILSKILDKIKKFNKKINY